MKNDEARQKLIRAAGQVFAEVGYDAATVRQITDRAEVNVASINYHFGDKLHLYREVLSETFSQRTHLLGQRCSGVSQGTTAPFYRVDGCRRKRRSETVASHPCDARNQ